jgi:mRNA interferase HigB
MLVIGTGIVGSYFASHAGHRRTKVARSQYHAWLRIATAADWRTPEHVKAAYPKASILRAGRVVFNIKGNDFRLVTAVQYQIGLVAVRFFGAHSEYDTIYAETV